MSSFDNFNTTDRAELERLSMDDLNAILDASYEPDTRISMDTLLLVLDVIEKRVGKTPSPSLDAAWENIKKEHLLHPVEHGAEAEHETDIENVQSIDPKTRKQKKILTSYSGCGKDPQLNSSDTVTSQDERYYHSTSTECQSRALCASQFGPPHRATVVQKSFQPPS